MIDDEITNFFSCYFHEDWPMEAESDVDVIRVFLRSGVNAAQANQLADQLVLIAKNHENEPSDAWLLSRYGCYYSPEADGLRASEWVIRLADLIRNESIHG